MTKTIVIGLIVILCSCREIESGQYRNRTSDTVSTKEIAEKVTIDYTDSGLLRARIMAPLMVGVKKIANPFVEMPKGIKVNFFREDGGVESYLTAEYGISYTEKKKVIVRRKVEVLNVKGDTMQTEELIWDQNTGRITSDKFVVIKTKTQIITGQGMESDQTFSDWEIRKPIGTIYKTTEPND